MWNFQKLTFLENSFNKDKSDIVDTKKIIKFAIWVKLWQHNFTIASVWNMACIVFRPEALDVHGQINKPTRLAFLDFSPSLLSLFPPYSISKFSTLLVY